MDTNEPHQTTDTPPPASTRAAGGTRPTLVVVEHDLITPDLGHDTDIRHLVTLGARETCATRSPGAGIEIYTVGEGIAAFRASDAKALRMLGDIEGALDGLAAMARTERARSTTRISQW